MRTLWLLWIFAVLLLLLFISFPKWTSDSPPSLALQHEVSLALPILAIIIGTRPNLLLRLLSSISIQDVRLVIVQQGNSSKASDAMQRLKVDGHKFHHLQFVVPAGPAELWNSAISYDPSASAWLLFDESVVFPPGGFAQFLAAVWEQQQLVAQGRSPAVLLAPGTLHTIGLWRCFALLQPAVARVGRFDPNFYPASQEGPDYLVRLSRAGLWLRTVPAVRLLPDEEGPSWSLATPAARQHAARQQGGRPYFALKWGQADTVGVFDVAGHWNQTCGPAGDCAPALPVLYQYPFNDPELPLSFAPSDPGLRRCVLYGGQQPCRFDRQLLPRPWLLPQGSFNTSRWMEEPDEPPKKFVYLIQGPKVQPMHPPISPSPQRDIIWLTYADRSGDIYLPKSTWTQGRNRLLDEAMRRSVRMPQGGYLYYVFMDYDVIINLRQDRELWYRSDLPDDVYERFEMFLTDWEPAVGTVAFRWTLADRTTVSIHHNNDALFSAHHRETLSFGLPYIGDLDCYSWYYSQHIMNSLNAMLHNTHRVQFNAMEAHNAEHAAYVREMMWLRPSCFALTSTLPTSPLHNTLTVDPNPSFTSGEPARRDGASYVVPLAFLRRHFNASHSIVRRALAFRQRRLVQHVLSAAQHFSPGEYTPDHRTCTAAGPLDRRCFSEACPPELLISCPAA